MSTYDEINKAIEAHKIWKEKLRIAVNTGKSESTPERVSMDNNCSFGKWLYERIDPVEKNSPFYLEVIKVHALFHKEAGKILELAVNGQKKEARELMVGVNFSKYTVALIQELKNWQATL